MTATVTQFGRRARASATIAIACNLLLFVPIASGQHMLRNLTGIVTDRHHEPLNGAVIQVDDEDNNHVVSYITDRSGRYSFKRLDGETDYRVSVTWRGHRSSAKTISMFDANQSKIINFVIRLQ